MQYEYCAVLSLTVLYIPLDTHCTVLQLLNTPRREGVLYCYATQILSNLIGEFVDQSCVQMVDANQRWDVGQAIAWMRALAFAAPLWIEEPTSPDDVLGHKAIADALRPLGSLVLVPSQCTS